MAATASNASSLSKTAGLAIMGGVVLLLVASIFYPGGAVIDPVDQTDFNAALGALGENASLGHLTTMVSTIGMLLYGYGFFTLFRLLQRQRSLGDVALRFGIVASMFGWGIYIIGMGMRHGAIHFMQRSAMETGTEAQAISDLALVCHTITIGLVLAFLATYPVASALVGIGLAPRFSTANIFKLASLGLVAVGAAGFINFLVVQHAPGISIETLLLSNNLILFIGSIFLFIIGLGLHRGRSELIAEDSPG